MRTNRHELADWLKEYIVSRQRTLGADDLASLAMIHTVLATKGDAPFGYEHIYPDSEGAHHDRDNPRGGKRENARRRSGEQGHSCRRLHRSR